MDFKKLSNQALHLSLEKLTHSERKITHLILCHLVEAEARRLYFEFGFESLYSYLTKGLKYSESAAYRRIQAARLLKVTPAVAQKLETGALNLSQLAQVQKCLKEECKKGTPTATEKINEVLLALESKSTFESEKILAKEFNLPMKTFESTKPQKDESIRLELTLSKEEFAVLEQAKFLLSHQCPDGRWSDVITTLAKKFNQSRLGKEKTIGKRSELFKAEVLQVKSGVISDMAGGLQNKPEKEQSKLGIQQNKPAASPRNTASHNTAKLLTATSKTEKYRPTLPLEIKRQVFAKAKHQCEFVDSTSGQKCTSKYQLETDHRKPLALGGDSSPDNLRVLCRVHNQRAWQLSLGNT